MFDMSNLERKDRLTGIIDGLEGEYVNLDDQDSNSITKDDKFVNLPPSVLDKEI